MNSVMLGSARVLLIGLIVAVPLLLLPGHSSATATTDPYGLAKNYPEDVQGWADTAGVSLDTALSRMNAREQFDQGLAAISDTPDVYAGAYFTQDSKSYVVHVVVKDGATPTVALPSSNDLSVVYESAPRSLTDLNGLMATVRESGIDYGEMEPDISTGRLSIVVPSAADYNDALKAFSGFADISIGPRPEPASCSDRFLCTYWRGGIEVIDTPTI